MSADSDADPVLVVTRLDDSTADVVIAELRARSVPVVRLDPGDFPEQVTLSASFTGQGLSGSLRTATRTVDLDTVRSVYWRRPSPYSAGEGVAGPDAQWCAEQARYGLGGVLAALPGAHYVNHPHRNRAAERKPAQLAAAARFGLSVPPTLVTNDPDQARRFAEEFGPVVYKPLWNSDYADSDGRALTVWVEELDPDTLDAGVRHTAHLFQKLVDKQADLRVTVVGEELFAVRIDGAAGLDWRRSYETLSYTLVQAPPDVAKAIHGFMDAFGLVYGAFDFGLDKTGRWELYELNPNGQFAWFPEPITARITAAIADQLQHGGRDDR